MVADEEPDDETKYLEGLKESLTTREGNKITLDDGEMYNYNENVLKEMNKLDENDDIY